MSDGGRKRAEAIFQQALELPPEQREAFLDTQCGTDAALRGAVEALLGVSDGALGNFLRTPVPTSDRDPAADEVARWPQRIGRYRILRVIGIGGLSTTRAGARRTRTGPRAQRKQGAGPEAQGPNVASGQSRGIGELRVGRIRVLPPRKVPISGRPQDAG